MHHAIASALYIPRPFLDVSLVHVSQQLVVRSSLVQGARLGFLDPPRRTIAKIEGIVVASGSWWVYFADVWMAA